MKPLIDPINTDDGQFHGRDNQTGALATIVTPVYMNDTQGATRSLQQEVISVLKAAGIKPADATNDQLLSALKDLFLAEDDSRVSGALQKDKNLSDLTDVAKAKTSLSLDKVGNWPAVQANGGLHSSGNHRIYIDWGEDGKAHLTVDASDEGELFTTVNPPTPTQSNSYPMWGGDLNRGASLGVISADQSPNTGDTIYSSWVRCCLGGRGGDQDFKDGATGLMRVVEHVGSEAYLEVLWDGFGSAHSFKFDQNGNIRADGGLYDGSGRVYSPGNCPFPVGYVMLMGNGTNPNGIYPGTTWQFLNGTGYDGRVIALGQDPLATGGSNSVTLAEAHMPPHRHNGGATGDASTQPDAGSAAWGTGRFGTDAKGGYALMQTSAAGSGQAFSVQNEYVHLMGWMRTA